MLEDKKVFQIDHQMLGLKDLEHDYGLNPSTIKRERWEQKKVKENKLKEGQKVKTDGFGYTTPAHIYYGRLMYRRADVEAWIQRHAIPAPAEALEDNA